MDKKESSDILKRISADRCTQLLSEMVKTYSVNPFDSEGRAETDFVKYFAGTLRKMGLEVEEQSAGNGRFNVIGFLEGKSGGPTIMLNSHMDTVGVEGMTEPFNPKIRGDELFGRGSCDDKGGLASMVMALEAIIGSKSKINGRVMIAGVCDEEYKSIGTDKLVDKFKADYSVVGEPTGCTLGVTHKGFVWVKLTAKGKSVHGSVPEKGVDAIEKMGHLITSVQNLGQKYQDRSPHPLLGKPRLHMGTIRGGTAPSVVPDFCELVFEVRNLPGVTGEMVLEDVKEFVEEAARKDPKLEVDISMPFQRIPFEVNPTNPFIKAVENAYKDVTGKRITVNGLPYWTDAAIIADRLKIPTCVLGPGDIRYAHSHNEHINLKELEVAAKVYASLIMSMGTWI